MRDEDDERSKSKRPERMGPRNPVPSFGGSAPVSAENETVDELQMESKEMDDAAPLQDKVLLEEPYHLMRELVRVWVCKMAEVHAGMSPEAAAQTGGELFKAGSFGLGILEEDSIADVVAVVPRHITLPMFQQDFYCALTRHTRVTYLSPVRQCYMTNIPGIEVGVGSSSAGTRVRFQVTCAILPVEAIAKSTLSDMTPAQLDGLDEVSKRCASMALVAQRIWEAVLPRRAEFQLMLRVIRQWARQRGLYTPYAAALNGVSCAILTARVCQLHPNTPTVRLINRFFCMYDQVEIWSQPIAMPGVDVPDGTCVAWETIDGDHDAQDEPVCVVVTPAYPHWNTTAAMMASTRRALAREMRRGFIAFARSPAQSGSKTLPFHTLWEPCDFYSRFQHYLQLDFAGENATICEGFKKWALPRITKLTSDLKSMANARVQPSTETHPFTDLTRPSWTTEAFFIGLRFGRNHSEPEVAQGEEASGQPKQRMDIRDAVLHYIKIASAWPDKAHFSGRVDLRVSVLDRASLPSWCLARESEHASANKRIW